MNDVAESLKTLRDLEAVTGSFVLGKRGQVLARDLPRVFDDEVLSEIGPRVLRLFETLGGSVPGLDAWVMHFSNQHLFLKATDQAFVCVMTATAPNIPAVRMAVNLVSRRIDHELASSGSTHTQAMQEASTGMMMKSVSSPPPPPRRSGDDTPSPKSATELPTSDAVDLLWDEPAGSTPELASEPPNSNAPSSESGQPDAARSRRRPLLYRGKPVG